MTPSPADQIVVSGAREHNLKDITVDPAARRAGRHHRAVGLGQVVARLRHDLRRGPAPLRRVADRLRAPVPRPDGQARRGLDRGPVAGHLDRPEDDLAQPALDGRHGHRDLRLPAPAVGAGRPSRTATSAAARSPASRPSRSSTRSWSCRTRHALHGRGARRARAQGRVRGSCSRSCAAEGFTRAKIDGELRRLEEDIELDKKYKHDISVVVDRLVMREDLRKRLADSIETAVGLAEGIVDVELVDSGEVRTYSERFMCLHCGTSMPELEPRIFSFNSPHGACPRCTGLGSQMEIDPELIVPDPSLSIGEGAIVPWSTSASNYYEQITQAIADRYEIADGHAVGGPARGAAGLLPLRHQRRPHLRLLPQPLRAASGPTRPRSRASSPTSSGATARPTPTTSREKIEEYMSVVPVPGVRGRAAAARVARGAGRRDAASTSSRRCPRTGRWSGSPASSSPTPSGGSPG